MACLAFYNQRPKGDGTKQQNSGQALGTSAGLAARQDIILGKPITPAGLNVP